MSNFYEQLYNSILHDSKHESDLNSDLNKDKLCLITYDKLEDDYIKLECGHKFNYKPIFNEIYNQKKHVSEFEIQKLELNQIKCPYCRNIQDTLLPPMEGFKNINGVNSPLRYCMKNNNCKYVFKSGCRKGNICNRLCMYKYCGSHVRYVRSNKDLSDKDKTVFKIKDEIDVLNERSNKLYKFIKRNNAKCAHETCKCKSIGEQDKCFKHMETTIREMIFNYREERVKLSKRIERLKDNIKLHNMLENIE